MNTYRSLRTFAVIVGVALGVLALASPAGAEELTIEETISAGTDKVAIGTATFTRTTTEDGETLTVHMDVAAGIDESSICLSDQPFTSRLAPGGCDYKQDATGTTADYVIDLGTAYLGETLYVQAHVVSGEDTGFAGWVDGNPFFGNVEVRVVGSAVVPVGAVGGLGLGLMAAGLLGAVSLRRRSPATAH